MTDPAGPKAGRHRVLRGGCWAGDGGDCRSALRDGSEPGFRVSLVGFRPVLGRSFPGLAERAKFF
jgi:formylglycine-generating enzyme required for sulfatase activity